MAYRYMGSSEAGIVRKSGTIPNVDRLGYPRQVFTTTNLYTTTEQAETVSKWDD